MPDIFAFGQFAYQNKAKKTEDAGTGLVPE
jgi:hypothetical protein